MFRSIPATRQDPGPTLFDRALHALSFRNSICTRLMSTGYRCVRLSVGLDMLGCRPLCLSMRLVDGECSLQVHPFKLRSSLQSCNSCSFLYECAQTATQRVSCVNCRHAGGKLNLVRNSALAPKPPPPPLPTSRFTARRLGKQKVQVTGS